MKHKNYINADAIQAVEHKKLKLSRSFDGNIKPLHKSFGGNKHTLLHHLLSMKSNPPQVPDLDLLFQENEEEQILMLVVEQWNACIHYEQ